MYYLIFPITNKPAPPSQNYARAPLPGTEFYFLSAVKTPYIPTKASCAGMICNYQKIDLQIFLGCRYINMLIYLSLSMM